MVSTLELFQKSLVGSNSTISDYISTISSKGDFKKMTNLEVILKSWNNILMTPVRTADHDPEYGSELYKFIFEPADNFTKDKIIEEIQHKLETYDDRARITNITVSYFSNGKGFSVFVTVDYNGEEGELTIPISEQNFASYI